MYLWLICLQRLSLKTSFDRHKHKSAQSWSVNLHGSKEPVDILIRSPVIIRALHSARQWHHARACVCVFVRLLHHQLDLILPSDEGDASNFIPNGEGTLLGKTALHRASVPLVHYRSPYSHTKTIAPANAHDAYKHSVPFSNATIVEQVLLKIDILSSSPSAHKHHSLESNFILQQSTSTAVAYKKQQQKHG